MRIIHEPLLDAFGKVFLGLKGIEAISKDPLDTNNLFVTAEIKIISRTQLHKMLIKGGGAILRSIQKGIHITLVQTVQRVQVRQKSLELAKIMIQFETKNWSRAAVSGKLS